MLFNSQFAILPISQQHCLLTLIASPAGLVRGLLSSRNSGVLLCYVLCSSLGLPRRQLLLLLFCRILFSQGSAVLVVFLAGFLSASILLRPLGSGFIAGGGGLSHWHTCPPEASDDSPRLFLFSVFLGPGPSGLVFVPPSL
jgi:hypothetical protein